MITWEEIIQRYLVKYSNQISRVTKPLADSFNLKCIDYIKTYDNGRFIYLTDRPDTAEYSASMQMYRIDPCFKKSTFYQPGFFWLVSRGSDEFKNCFSKVTAKFDIHDPLLLIENGFNYVEMFCFSGGTEEAIRTMHSEHSQLLRIFTKYYREELGPVLNKMEEESYSLIDLQGEGFYANDKNSTVDRKKVEEFLNAMGKHEEVRKASSLSSRERDCLRLLIHGNSAKDSAAELKLSPRTIEFYLDNAKNKLNCSSKRELFSIASELKNLGLL